MCITKINKPLFIALILCFSISCSIKNQIKSYQTDSLSIQLLTKETYNHISYLPIKNYGNFPCNGMIVVDNGEAMIFDTPINDSVSKELIDWVENKLKCKIKGIVVNHFHVDCLGGLEAFHQKNIPSYASNETIKLAEEDEATVPQNGFDDYLELQVGEKKIINEFLGAGHTLDNIVSYVPDDKVLFGGCLIKSMGAGTGNLKDADVEEWANSVRKVKEKYGEAKVVIPGHGDCGGVELLDYTIEKFSSE